LGNGSILFVSIDERGWGGRDSKSGKDLVIKSGSSEWAYSLDKRGIEIDIIQLTLMPNGDVEVTADIADPDHWARGERTAIVSNEDLTDLYSSLGEDELQVSGINFKKLSGPDPSAIS